MFFLLPIYLTLQMVILADARRKGNATDKLRIFFLPLLRRFKFLIWLRFFHFIAFYHSSQRYITDIMGETTLFAFLYVQNVY